MTIPIRQLKDGEDNQDFYPETVKAAVADWDAVTATNVIRTDAPTAIVTTAMINNGAVTADKLNSDTIDKIYPVGSIYMSATLSTAEQVEEALGGEWTAWGTGRVPVGVDTTQTEFNTVGKTGGEKTHTLSQGELPKITSQPHANFMCHQSEDYEDGALTYKFGGYANTSGGGSFPYGQMKLDIGNNQAHNNLQPYITCYMYRRTA